ncbi:selenocysteine-tRNA-specific elongation factor, partial [Trypanosoma cruzi]
MPLPSRTFPFEDDSGAEDQVLHFPALDVDTWAPCVWNDVISGVLVDLRCAYGYIFALSGLSGSNGHRWFGVVQTRTGDRSGAHRSVHGFWQGPTADLSDADRDNNRPQHIPPSTLRARLHMAVHEADEHARATQPLVERRVTQQKQRLSRSQLCRIYGHDASTRNVRSAACRDYSQRTRPLKNGEGLPAAYESGRKQPHPFHHLPPLRTGVAPYRRHFIR